MKTGTALVGKERCHAVR